LQSYPIDFGKQTAVTASKPQLQQQTAITASKPQST